MTKENIIALALSVLIIHSALSYAQGLTANNPSIAQGEKMYMHYCSSCHGNKGDGKGFNAKNLDPRPAVHTDSAFMSKRTNKDLRDAITGGRSIGKSTLMPPWGNTFTETQIQSLVLYIRKLCKCQG